MPFKLDLYLTLKSLISRFKLLYALMYHYVLFNSMGKTHSSIYVFKRRKYCIYIYMFYKHDNPYIVIYALSFLFIGSISYLETKVFLIKTISHFLRLQTHLQICFFLSGLHCFYHLNKCISLF